MKDIDKLIQEDIANYEGLHEDLIYQAPALYRLMLHLLDDPNLPGRLRPLVITAIAYFALPADIMPEDLEGPSGYVDDIFLCAFIAGRIRTELKSDDILTANLNIPLPRPLVSSQPLDYIANLRPQFLLHSLERQLT
jgi:uncharacterized membrane protein YkvA (DUF1232 family)